MPLKQPNHIRPWRELIMAARFAVVGCTATAIHIGTVWLLFKYTSLLPIAINTIAFLTAFLVSFSGNYIWTFNRPQNARRAGLRFFVIAVAAYALNTACLGTLLHLGWFSELESAVVAATIVPAFSFVSSRLWCFK